jgi:hypothetical protein
VEITPEIREQVLATARVLKPLAFEFNVTLKTLRQLPSGSQSTLRLKALTTQD